MTTLHIVRQSAFSTHDYAQCIEVLRDNDVIVFIDDGCYNLHHPLTNNITSTMKVNLKVITQHAKARAVVVNNAVFSEIEMTDLILLTFENDRVITWQ